MGKKQVLGFHKSELESAALLLVVNEEGTYQYVSSRPLREVASALTNVLHDVKVELESGKEEF